MSIDLTNTTYVHSSQEENEQETQSMLKYVPPAEAQERSAAALRILFQYSQIDGAHHKMWSLDQVARILTGDRYDQFIADYVNVDADGEPEYDWDEGIAP